MMVISDSRFANKPEVEYAPPDEPCQVLNTGMSLQTELVSLRVWWASLIVRLKAALGLK